MSCHLYFKTGQKINKKFSFKFNMQNNDIDIVILLATLYWLVESTDQYLFLLFVYVDMYIDNCTELV